MREFGRVIGGFVGVLMFLSGCGFLGFGLTGDTIEEFTPLVLAVTGGSLLLAGILLYNNLGNEELKDLLQRNNELLEQNAALIEKVTTTNIEIARRQFQAEKRQTGSLLSRDK